MKFLIALSVSLFCAQAAQAANCSPQILQAQMQASFSEAAKADPYKYKRVESAKFITSVDQGESVNLQAGFEDYRYTNDTLFDLAAYSVSTTDLLDRIFWIVLVDRSSCAVVETIAGDSTSVN